MSRDKTGTEYILRQMREKLRHFKQMIQKKRHRGQNSTAWHPNGCVFGKLQVNELKRDGCMIGAGEPVRSQIMGAPYTAVRSWRATPEARTINDGQMFARRMIITLYLTLAVDMRRYIEWNKVIKWEVEGQAGSHLQSWHLHHKEGRAGLLAYGLLLKKLRWTQSALSS